MLKAHASDGFVRIGGIKPFLDLDCLMQPLTPGTLRHGAPGKLIDDHHLVTLQDILLALFEKVVSDQSLLE